MIGASRQILSPPPDQDGLRAPRRHKRRFVGAMRLVLPGIAIGLLVLVIAWPKFFGDVAGMIAPGLTFEGFTVTEPMRMRHPRYVGTDSSGGRPYEVIAEEAQVDPTAPDRITMLDMQAALEGDGGAKTRLDARNALYQRSVGRLDLETDVDLRTPDGTTFSTERATVLLPERQASGDAHVHGEGPRGTIDADGFAIEQGGDVIRFRGNVRVVLVQGDKAGGEAP
jgi:lipopolysaccharide export system protein LptC